MYWFFRNYNVRLNIHEDLFVGFDRQAKVPHFRYVRRHVCRHLVLETRGQVKSAQSKVSSINNSAPVTRKPTASDEVQKYSWRSGSSRTESPYVFPACRCLRGNLRREFLFPENINPSSSTFHFIQSATSFLLSRLSSLMEQFRLQMHLTSFWVSIYTSSKRWEGYRNLWNSVWGTILKVQHFPNFVSMGLKRSRQSRTWCCQRHNAIIWEQLCDALESVCTKRF